jgi:hypothetical protein
LPFYVSERFIKGKASKAVRGRYSAPFNTQMVASEALRRRDRGVIRKVRKFQEILLLTSFLGFIY